jgi:hypothetical protein
LAAIVILFYRLPAWHKYRWYINFWIIWNSNKQIICIAISCLRPARGSTVWIRKKLLSGLINSAFRPAAKGSYLDKLLIIYVINLNCSYFFIKI